MLQLIWHLSLRAAEWVQKHAPSNRLLNHLRKRENLKYGPPAMLLATPYLFAGWVVTACVEAGASDWWRLLFILALWNASKFLVFGPYSILKLRAEIRCEAEAQHASEDAESVPVSR